MTFLKKGLYAAALALLTISCERLDSLTEIPEGTSGDTGLYATALCYPDGYDWRKDSLGGRVNTQILLFRNGKEIMKIPVEKPEIPDPETHRFIGGHLYVITCTESHTIIRKDSLEIFRFEGRDCIDDITVSDTCIYTLSRPRKGDGWSFRRNGEVIVKGEGGGILGGFHQDRGHLYFAYWQPLTQNGSIVAKRYFIAKDGIQEQLKPESETDEICAIRHYGGQLHYLAKSSDYPGILWYNGKSARILDVDGGCDCRDASLVVVGGILMAHAQVNHPAIDRSAIWNDYYWESDLPSFKTSGANQICAFSEGAPYLSCVHSPLGSASPLTLCIDGKNSRLPDRYRLFSSRAFCRGTRNWGIGVSDAQDSYRPLIITGIDTIKMDFNGYVTSLFLP